jgi:hypothetical protein
MFKDILGQPARFVHLASRELTAQWWPRDGATGVGPTDECCPGGTYQGNGSHEILRLLPTQHPIHGAKVREITGRRLWF